MVRNAAILILGLAFAAPLTLGSEQRCQDTTAETPKFVKAPYVWYSGSYAFVSIVGITLTLIHLSID